MRRMVAVLLCPGPPWGPTETEFESHNFNQVPTSLPCSGIYLVRLVLKSSYMPHRLDLMPGLWSRPGAALGGAQRAARQG
ncbi:hypothetical protein VTI74DRAFT_1202 [Chaetomium olivicolor]